MAAKCDNPYSKRELRWTAEDCEISERYNLRKKLKALGDSSLENSITPIIPRTETKYNVKEKVDSTNSKQDELGKIYGEKEEKNVFDYEESESSEEEEEGITVEELKKTEGWNMLMKALDAKIEKNKLATK